jgi:hypothetical protein
VLDEQDYAEACRRYKDRRTKLTERQRYHALILVTQGCSFREIGRIFLIEKNESASGLLFIKLMVSKLSRTSPVGVASMGRDSYRLTNLNHSSLRKAINEYYQTTKRHTVNFLAKFGYGWKDGRLYVLNPLLGVRGI